MEYLKQAVDVLFLMTMDGHQSTSEPKSKRYSLKDLEALVEQAEKSGRENDAVQIRNLIKDARRAAQ